MWPFNSRSFTPRPSPDGEPDQLLRQRVVLIRGRLDENKATDVIARLLFLQYESPRKPVTLLIDSSGGSFTAGMAVIDTVRALAPPVRTRCHGDAHGIAAVILGCGRRGERVVVRGSSLSLTPVLASDPEVDGAALELERARQLIAGLVADAAGRKVESVAEDLAAGRFFDPAEAVEYGLADRVVK